MAANIATLRPYLQNFDLTRLMVEELGWNHLQSASTIVSVGNDNYDLSPVAEKAGFAVYRCSPGADGTTPNQNIRRQIERKVADTSYEHLIIFVDAAETQQVWQWVKRESGRPPALRELRYDQGQTGTALLQRLRGIEFTLAEEGNLGITDVTERFQQSLDVEKVTNRFYTHFRNELSTFQKFINGFTNQGDRDWYASLMLNRLMFTYFIQKQGFLDDDEHYLRNRLKKVQEQDGPDRFIQFYHKFLRRLFRDGLGKPEADRSVDLVALLGKVPYLNGGIFDEHILEQDNPDIDIPDAAFEQIFLFFDQYQWHLDDRPSGADNEINPDVLGYIFEKYVNQKQMGAYYTKEDITGYITRNTVIPRLLEMAQQECPIAFGHEGGAWCLLQDDPDNYIYPAVGHGVAWDYSLENVARLAEPLELPEHISVGLNDTAQRGDWNRAAPQEFALPTETWRELIARRQRYSEVRDQMAAGEVQSVNDLITLNLDSERFARDVIVNSEGPELVRAMWSALTKISVLDPACGSGAFLFAALNILEPLYSATMQAMRGFLSDLENAVRPRPLKALQYFRDVLNEAGKHRNERYYILKSIIVNNLYGVDIMDEAVEICRLRLFLKLAAQLESYAQIEPLPDIDFNIQAGNTLVGFTSAASVRRAMEIDLKGQTRMLYPEDEEALERIEAKAISIARSFQKFQLAQTGFGMGHAELAESKQDLQSKLNDLRGELDSLLAKEYAVDTNEAAAFQRWQDSHKPFHWFVEFYGIMSKGGFDVVVGNPPYVEYKNVRKDYSVKGFKTEGCGNLYAMTWERSVHLATNGHLGMIVPASAVCTDGYAPLRALLIDSGNVVVSSYSDNPGRLFDGMPHNRLQIILVNKGAKSKRTFATVYNKWRVDARQYLFHNLAFFESTDLKTDAGIAKIGYDTEASILCKLNSVPLVSQQLKGRSRQHVAYYTRKLSHFVQILNFIPSIYDSKGELRKPTELKEIRFDNALTRDGALGILNSSLFSWLVTVFSDCRNLNQREVAMIRFDVSDTARLELLATITKELMKDIEANSELKKQGNLTIQQTFPRQSKAIIDKLDTVLAEHFGFTDEELDFIINYDIKYRMGREE